MAHALVIDDDQFSLDILGQLLSLEQLTYTSVQEPNMLSEVLKTMPGIDVVFLDLEMPSIDGYKVFKYLRRELGLTIPIIACTVHLSEVHVVRELGFNGFLSKPVDAEQFPSLLQQILGGKQIWVARPD